MSLLSETAIQEFLHSTSTWRRRGDHLVCTVKFESFPQAIDFVTAVAQLAEAQQHHPDIDIRFREVSFALTTHDESGLTIKDLQLARDIEALASPFRRLTPGI